MSLTTVAGTVTALGQSRFDDRVTIYAYIEITDHNGRRITVERVAVGNEVAPALALGAKGDFFFDKIMALGGLFRFQLWGAKSDVVVAFDQSNFRAASAFAHLRWGIPLSLLVLGLPWLIIGVGQVALLIARAGERRRAFYGEDSAVAANLRQQEAIHL